MQMRTGCILFSPNCVRDLKGIHSVTKRSVKKNDMYLYCIMLFHVCVNEETMHSGEMSHIKNL